MKHEKIDIKKAQEILADLHQHAIDTNTNLLSKVEMDIAKFKSAYERAIRLLEARKTYLQEDSREHRALIEAVYKCG